MEEFASLLGPKEVLWLSQDDKVRNENLKIKIVSTMFRSYFYNALQARVPIGETAAHKQTPLVMHVEYRVQLPDHDWVVAEKHKLIPSVYAIIKIDDEKVASKNAVTYSGPTYICIRSAKHCSSTAYSHAKDMEALMNSESFASFCRTDSGEPVIIITTDGGPDENPWYF